MQFIHVYPIWLVCVEPCPAQHFLPTESEMCLYHCRCKKRCQLPSFPVENSYGYAHIAAGNSELPIAQSSPQFEKGRSPRELELGGCYWLILIHI